jgi:hypothetical protein
LAPAAREVFSVFPALSFHQESRALPGGRG